MLLAVAVVLGALLALLLYKKRSRGTAEVARETTPALDRFLHEALEDELAEGVLGVRGSTPEERRKLTRTLEGEPDVEVVGRIEELVRNVELEFVRYAHDADVEATVRVRYEDGKVGTATKRLALGDVPEGVRADFASKGGTRVFRSWAFPWQRVRAL
ncbi:MAG: hypothetical protein KF894_33300 [Labilithrix sp.]|nr:hypothetical protein [Labilithrix sp.]